MPAYFAVCNVNGPISVAIEADDVEGAVAQFRAMDKRKLIDDARCDAEYHYVFDGTSLSEDEFSKRLKFNNCVCIRSLDEVVNSHAGTVSHLANSWSLWEAGETPAVEVCWNVEWIRDFALNKHRIDEPDLWDAATAYRSEVLSALSDHGFDVEFAKGTRRAFHQWNGAHFKTRLGCVGSFQELTDEQITAVGEALNAADEAIKDWRYSDDELWELIAECVAEEELDCPDTLVDKLFQADKEGRSWREEFAEAVRKQREAEKVCE